MIYDLIYELTKKELRVRYKHLSFGYIWSIANPLAYALLYYVVFKTIMKVKVENFPIFLICGLFPWQWFTNAIGVGPSIFLGNASLIKKVKFPRNLLNFVSVLQDLIHFYASIPVIILFLIIFNISPSPSWIIGIPLFSLVQLLATYGASLLIGTINLFFRDLERLIQITMAFLFYATPVVYDLAMLPQPYKDLVVLNPLAPIIICWRNLFMHGYIDWYYFGFALAWALVTAGVAQLIYKKLSWRFAEIL